MSSDKKNVMHALNDLIVNIVVQSELFQCNSQIALYQQQLFFLSC